MVAEILRTVVRKNSAKLFLFGVLKSTMIAEILHPVVAINSVKTSLFGDIKSTMVAEILRPVVACGMQNFTFYTTKQSAVCNLLRDKKIKMMWTSLFCK